MKLIRIRTVFIKQIKETIVNKEILIQFLLFPIMALVLTNVIELENVPQDFFVKIFGAMYIGMAPLVTTASIISEEKESNTLRMLLFSNVKAGEYLLGISSYVFLLCMLGVLSLGFIAGYALEQLFVFMLLSMVGIIISILVGACVGLNSRSQMNANATAIPLMMVFSFVPMISTFNETIRNFADFIYTQQINSMFEHLSFDAFTGQYFLVMGCSMVFVLVLFFYSYRKKGIQM